MRKSALKYFKCILCNEANLKFKKLTYYNNNKDEILNGLIICFHGCLNVSKHLDLKICRVTIHRDYMPI